MSCDIIKRFLELLVVAQPSFSKEVLASVEQQLRDEYAGEQVYIPKHDKNRHEVIIHRFTGNNADKLASELRVSRRTIYRVVKKKRTTTK